MNDERNYKYIQEKKELKAPVKEEKELKAPVKEEKDLEASNNDVEVTKTMEVIPINMEGEQKVYTRNSVKSITNPPQTREESLKKEKTPKQNLKKETKIKKDIDTDSTK